jgi:PoNe immunity proteins (PoNi), C-terminal/PoNe immunity protein (PoNi), N-terminal
VEPLPSDPASRAGSSGGGGLRCRQPGVTRATLDEEIADFEASPPNALTYSASLRWWIARYSRGHPLDDLREAFAQLADQVERDGRDAQVREGDDTLLFRYDEGYVGRYRQALVLLSIALCLRRPESAHTVLRWCERGDALIEHLAAANSAPQADRRVPPPFPDRFDGLYAAVAATDRADGESAVCDYVSVWLDDRMDDMGFKIYDEGLGYWCFEAAGVVAALELDDSSCASEPVYPADLVAHYRKGSRHAN